MEPILTKQVGKYWWNRQTIKIFHDPEPPDPREEWDNFGTIVAWHRNYIYDEDGRKEYGDPDDFLEWAEENDYIMLPVYLFDHSGCRISTTSHQFRAADSHGWDWGQLGWIYVTRHDALKEFQIEAEDWNIEWASKAEKIMRQEIETLDDFYTNNVYGFTTYDWADEPRNSCWGFYGYTPEELAEEVANGNC